MKPEISVIIPYYEGRDFISIAINSVREQTYPAWELIVVDDGSMHTARDIVENLNDERIKYIQKEHSGKGATLNYGAAQSQAGILCFLDQDDRFLPDRLERQVTALLANQDVDAVYSDNQLVNQDGTVITTVRNRSFTSEEMIHILATDRSPLCMQSIMLRKNIFSSIGGFSEDPALTGLDDAEFFVRLALAGTRFVYVPGVAAQWVKHDGNFSASTKFHDTRLVLISHLSDIAQKCPGFKKELSFFKYHNYTMRGIYFLEHGEPQNAVKDLFLAICAHPASINAYYLFIKSLLLSSINRKMTT